jgi:putative hydrolase of the HAD superfamily
MIKTVIFDLDDTLYNYEFPNEKAYMEIFKIISAKGKNIEEIENALNEAKIYIKKNTTNLSSSHNRFLYIHKMTEILEIFDCNFEYFLAKKYWNVFINNIVKNATVRKLFNYIKENGIKIGICSNMMHDIQLRKIHKLKLSKYIDFLVTSEEAGVEKPSLKIYDLCKKKSSHEFNQILFIGDDYINDYEIPKKLGMHSLHLKKNADQDLINSENYDSIIEFIWVINNAVI